MLNTTKIIAISAVLILTVSAIVVYAVNTKNSPEDPEAEESVQYPAYRVKDLTVFDNFQKTKDGRPEGVRSYVYYNEPERETMNNHIQGYGHFYSPGIEWNIFTRSTDEDTGYIYFISSPPNNYKFEIKSPQGRGSHPGGFQVYGHYMIVGVESETNSSVFLYDLIPLASGEKPGDPVLLLEGSRKNLGVGASAMTFMGEKGDKFVFAVMTDYEVKIYTYNDVFIYDKIDKDKFVQVPATTNSKYMSQFDGRSYQGIQLFCDVQGSMYMLGMFSNTILGLPKQDYFDIYKLYDGPTDKWFDTPDRKVNKREVKLIHREGELTPHAGVHFRYGSSMDILSEDEVQINACSRNFYDEKFVTVNKLVKAKPGEEETGGHIDR